MRRSMLTWRLIYNSPRIGSHVYGLDSWAGPLSFSNRGFYHERAVKGEMQISGNVRILIEAARVTPPLFLPVASQVPARIKVEKIQFHNKNTKLLRKKAAAVWKAIAALNLDDNCGQIQIRMKTKIEQIQMFEALHRRGRGQTHKHKYKVFGMQRRDSALDKSQIWIQIVLQKYLR